MYVLTFMVDPCVSSYLFVVLAMFTLICTLWKSVQMPFWRETFTSGEWMSEMFLIDFCIFAMLFSRRHFFRRISGPLYLYANFKE